MLISCHGKATSKKPIHLNGSSFWTEAFDLMHFNRNIYKSNLFNVNPWNIECFLCRLNYLSISHGDNFIGHYAPIINTLPRGIENIIIIRVVRVCSMQLRFWWSHLDRGAIPVRHHTQHIRTKMCGLMFIYTVKEQIEWISLMLTREILLVSFAGSTTWTFQMVIISSAITAVT